MQSYQILGRKGEGAFSEVLKAQNKMTQQFVAIKCMKKRFKSMDQVNRLREVMSIRRLQSHPNIVKFIHVLFDHSTGRLALVFELMDMNLYELIKDRRQYLPEDRITLIMYQMLKGIEYMHSQGLLHRDIKPENMLVNVEDGALKIADFGSSRSIHCNQPFTEYISTRWYRSPECLLTDGYYGNKMDLWSAGCIFFEVLSLFPLFPGSNELDQIHRIHNVLGTPSLEVLERLKARGSHMAFDFPQKQGTGLAKLLPNASPEAMDLLSKLLVYDENERIAAKEALRHPYFKKLREAERKERSLRTKRVSDPDLLSSTDGKIDSSRKTTPLESNAAIVHPRLPLIDNHSPTKVGGLQMGSANTHSTKNLSCSSSLCATLRTSLPKL